MEYSYYLILKDRLDKGEITDLHIHPKFVLINGFVKNNKVWKPMHYEADFQFYDNTTKTTRIIDVKGFVMPEFEMHWKLFEHFYPFSHLEVLKYSKTTGWVELENYKKIMKSKKQLLSEDRTRLKKKLERMSFLNKRILDIEAKLSKGTATKNDEKILHKFSVELNTLMTEDESKK
jgi:hypothetical protein